MLRLLDQTLEQMKERCPPMTADDCFLGFSAGGGVPEPYYQGEARSIAASTSPHRPFLL
jgi:hypothetical protein